MSGDQRDGGGPTSAERRRRPRSAALAVVGGALAIGLAAACSSSGGSSSAGGATATTAAPATSRAPGTTAPATAATTGAAGAGANDARATAITAADLGGTWTELRPGEAWAPTTGGCGSAATASLSPQSAWIGPTFQRGDAKVYVSSTVYVFPTVAEAQAYVAERNSPEYVECKRVELSDNESKTGSGVTYKTAETTNPAIGSNGLEGYTAYTAQTTKDGVTTAANGSISRSTLRKGRVVVSLQVDAVASPTDPAGLFTTAGEEASLAVAQALARAPE